MALKNKKLLIFLCISAIIVIVDRLTKIFSSRIVGCCLLCISRSENYGAAFSLLSGFSWTRVFLIIIALGVLFFTIFFYFKTKTRNLTMLHIGLILLFAGTLGNLIDRIFLGYVIDFIKFGFWRAFPAFNISDLSNIAGVVLLIISLVKRK